MSKVSVAANNNIVGFTKIGLLCKKHIKDLFFDHLNINSLTNKIEYLEPLIRNLTSFWSVKQNLFLVFRGLNLRIPVIDYFVNTEINIDIKDS